MSQPHASWATGYDQLNEKSFGSVYHQLAQHTLVSIESLTTPDSRTVDFEMGTLRPAPDLVHFESRWRLVWPTISSNRNINLFNFKYDVA